jgi:hypothetical protein
MRWCAGGGERVYGRGRAERSGVVEAKGRDRCGEQW